MGTGGDSVRTIVVHEEVPLSERAGYVGSIYALGATGAFIGWVMTRYLFPDHEFELGKMTLIAGGIGGVIGLALAVGKGLLY